jgi:Ca2+-binding RTX toxin-like protein
MATFDFHRLGFGVNTDDIIAQVLNYGPLKSLSVLKPTDSEFWLDPAGPTKIKYLGEDFKYNDKNDPKAGIIESVEVTAKPGFESLRFKITGLDIDIGDMKDAFKSATPADDLAFVAGIFKGDDTFIGTDHDDKFYGLGGKDTMNGDKGNDSLDGGSGKDVLRGQSGNDELKGGSGKDFFVFDTSAKSTNNVDIILDFNSADDTIRLDNNSIYKSLGDEGVLAANMFHVGELAGHKNGGIIYDANGDLWYDPADRGAVKFAHLDGHPTITHEDFVIV